MAFIDFSLDSRIRKKYVPLTTQQRFMRHMKRVAARNLCIPDVFIQPLIESSLDTESKNLELSDSNSNDSTIDDIEENQSLILKLNIAFYFTVLYPPTADCQQCHAIKTTAKTWCNCNKLLYRSELVFSANPSWKPFEGSTFCSPSVSQFIIQIYFVQLDANNQLDNEVSGEHITSYDTLTGNAGSKRSHYSHSISKKNVISNDKSSEDKEIGTLFLQWKVHLSGLICIGEEIPKDRRLAKNAIIFGLHEGFYTSVDSVASDDLLNHIVPPTEVMQIRQAMSRDSYCLNTLTRIQMVQFIYQATAVEMQRAKNSLEEAMEKTKVKRELSGKIEKLQSSIQFLSNALVKRKSRLNNSRETLAKVENDIFELNADMSSRVQILKEEIHRLLQFRSEKLVDTRRRLETVYNSLLQRRRVLAKELFQIYRIVPFPDSRGFSICGIYLPDAEHIEGHNEKMVAIALGYVTHLLAILSTFLDINLNYQLIPFGSRSMLVDTNNQVLRDEEKFLPLYPRSGRNAIFFKYGLYLLNRTIAYIRRTVGLKTQSIALTLANLYTLFTESLLVDNYNVSNDFSLNRFSLYSPSFDKIDPSLLVPNSDDLWNQHFLNDINFIKDNDCMNECLWREVEALTINVALNRPNLITPAARSNPRTLSVSPSIATTTSSSSLSSGSSICSSSQSPYIEEIKQSIAKQRQRRRTASTQRLSQITSSLSSSYASVSSAPIRMTVTSPEDIIRQRRVSTTLGLQVDSSPQLMYNASRHSPRAPHFLPSHRRIRSISGYSSHQLSSSSVRSSFLHPNLDPAQSSDALNQQGKFTPRRKLSQNQPFMSCSLDKGLNKLMCHASSSSINSSMSNQSDKIHIEPSTSNPTSVPSGYLNVEMLDIRYGRVVSEENGSFEENRKVVSVDSPQINRSWLHAAAQQTSTNGTSK